MMHLDLRLVEKRRIFCSLNSIAFRLGARLIFKIFDEQNREKIEHIVQEIRSAFIEALPRIEWMDLETRRQAQMKARMIIGILQKFIFICKLCS